MKKLKLSVETGQVQSVSNTLLDFGLLTGFAISVLTTYRAVCFY